MSTIDLLQVSKHFGAIVAADRVDLHVDQGELVTILGPSGSGKTTLLTMIAGLADPTAGRIDIGGRDVTWLPAAKRNVGLVFQSYALFPHMSVFDNIAFPLSVRSLDKPEIGRRVVEALRLVRLSGFEPRRPSQLSGGQQQRVALARAFVFEPEIMLLDEPLGALDRKLREEVQVELRQLQRSLGITTVLVTHDQEEALSLSDRILVLDEGRVQQIGTPEEVYLRPRNRFVADFLGTANFFDGTLERNGEGFHIRLEHGDVVACADPGIAAGSEVSAIVRPERITLASDGADGLPVRVSDVIYLGQSVRYHLETRQGHEIVAASTDRGIRFAPGESVRLTWPRDDVWVIPEAADQASPESTAQAVSAGALAARKSSTASTKASSSSLVSGSESATKPRRAV
jgi:putative spermidine/putrescine transport system ATP-binding protein